MLGCAILSYSAPESVIISFLFLFETIADDNLTSILFLVYSLDSSHHPDFHPVTCQGRLLGGGLGFV